LLIDIEILDLEAKRAYIYAVEREELFVLTSSLK